MQAVHATGIQYNWDIYTNDGEHLGTAKMVTDKHVIVEKGRIFKHDLYIPLSSFMEADETERRATLSINNDQIDSMGWDQPVDDSSLSSGGGSAANDLPPVIDSAARLRPQFTDQGQGAIDQPEPAQPSIETEPRSIDS